MPSGIDPTKPVTGQPASKADLRANLQAAKKELEHGGFAEDFSPANYTPTPADTKVTSHLAGIDAVLGGAGATTFLGLADTPSSYSGQANRYAKVNAGATALEFVDQAAGGDASTTAYTPAGTGAVVRTVQARLRDLPSVKDFGALGNSTGTTGNGNDDTAAIQAALDAHGIVYLPPGIYRITSTLVLPGTSSTEEGAGLIGVGRERSILFADGITGSNPGEGAAIRTSAPGQFTYHPLLTQFSVSGTCHTGVTCSGSQGARLHDISIMPQTVCTDGFYLHNCFGCSFTDLDTNSATIDQNAGAAFKIANDYQANYAHNWYAGGGSRPFYGIHMNLNQLHGNVINSPTMQCCRYGIYIQKMQNMGGLVINGLYTENTVTAIRLGGSAASGELCRGVAISGCTLGGPEASHPHYASRTALIELGYAYGVSIQGCSFEGAGPGLDAIQYYQCGNVFLAGNYVSVDGLGTDITKYIKRMAGGADSGSGFVIFQPGINGQSQLIMKADGFAFRHYKMSLNSSGAWVATEWIPAAAT